MKNYLSFLFALSLCGTLLLYGNPLQLEFDESAYCQYQFTKDKDRKESIVNKITQYINRSIDCQKFKLDKKTSTIACDERNCIEHIYAKSKMAQKPKDKVIIHYMRSFTYKGTQNLLQNLLICSITNTFNERIELKNKDRDKKILEKERGGENRKIIFQSQPEKYSYSLTELKKKEKKIEKYLQKAKDNS